MTNFVNPIPYINEKKTLPPKQREDKRGAVKEAVAIIRENKRLIEKATKTSYANPHR